MDVDNINSLYSKGFVGIRRTLSLATSSIATDGNNNIVSSLSWNTCPGNKILPNVETASPGSPVIRTYGGVPLIFISTPKCGSTSITDRLDELFGERTELWLQKPEQVATLVNAWNTSVVFSVVRNPWTRFCSIYNFCRTDEQRIGPIEEYPTFLDASKDPTMLKNHCIRTESHWLPYTNHFVDQDDKSVYYDCMLRTEHMGEDWVDFRAYVNKTVGLDVGEIPGHITYGSTGIAHKVSVEKILKKDYCQAYYDENPAAVGHVQDFFHEDIAHFGYSYPYEGSVESDVA